MAAGDAYRGGPGFGGGGVTDHGLLTGLSDDDHTIYALLAGRAGGQTLKGGTASGEKLGITSTAHATKGTVFIGVENSGLTFDEVNTRLGLGMAPAAGFRLKLGGGADEHIGIVTDSRGWDVGVGAFASGDDHFAIYDTTSNKLRIVCINAGGDVIIGNPASATVPEVIATNATAGMLRITVCDGVPTGAAANGCIVGDNTNGKLYARLNGAWQLLN